MLLLREDWISPMLTLTKSYQKLSPWICSPLDRSSRVFLETHLDLLSGELDEFLEAFIQAHNDEQEQQQRLRLSVMRLILQDSERRGGTVEAVRETYVNLFGGLLLDPPSWLQEVENEWAAFVEEPWTERRLTVCKLQLKAAIERAQAIPETAPEIIAELQYELGNFFANDSAKRTPAMLQTAIDYYTQALQVYTAERYPLRCARIWLTLGDVYRRLADNQHADLLLKSLHYYSRAMAIYNSCGLPIDLHGQPLKAGL
jgi:hypothetical protein